MSGYYTAHGGLKVDGCPLLFCSPNEALYDNRLVDEKMSIGNLFLKPRSKVVEGGL